MRNAIIKIMLVAVTLSTLAACGPSKEEKALDQAKAIRRAYNKSLEKSDARLMAHTKEERAKADLEAEQAHNEYVRVIKQAGIE